MFDSSQQSTARESTLSSNVKPWFNNSSNARIPPFLIIPRAINTKKHVGANSEADEDSSDSDNSDDEDDNEDDGDGEERQSAESSKKATNLDSQVKNILVGPASSNFGSKKFKQLSSNYPRSSSGLKNSHIVNDSDAPPKVSLYDLDQDNDDDFEAYNGSNNNNGAKTSNPLDKDNTLNASNTKHSRLNLLQNNAPISTAPESFNVFNSNFFSSLTSKSGNSFTALKNQHPQPSPQALNSSLTSITSSTISGTSVASNAAGEYPIIVYGYKEADSVQVIQFFNKFGEILENFEILNKKRNNLGKLLKKNNDYNIPIYLGESWIKFTYNNQSSYMRALKEDTSIFKNYHITVKPFSIDLLNQLKSGSLKVTIDEVSQDQAVSDDSLFPNRANETFIYFPKEDNESVEPANPSQGMGAETTSGAQVNNNASSVLLSSHDPDHSTILDNITNITKNTVYNIFNQETSGLFGHHKPIEEEEATIENQPKRAKVDGHRLQIINNKQVLLLKNKTSSNRKKLNSLTSPHLVNNANESWVSKTLDWAFGFNSL